MVVVLRRRTLEFVIVTNLPPRLLKGNGKSPGPDKVSTMLVKDAADLICKPLVMIYNSSMETGVFPDLWKFARVTPIFKSGNKSNANNYRPISIISVFARIFEKIIHDQLHNFLTINNILTSSQSAFRKLHSTITSLINCTDIALTTGTETSTKSN